ncbi:CRISPR-associated endonuclease/helicase Cas3 [Streptomyces sp. RB5]|uniref:CRISPR-associated endonuclease/helicase Cas3 n=1 Tax=Streptomyces smaragdinus TaxID=2585196 RepID=A0A7K0CNX5_9ACTN|nr:CRISPR-associated helicase Cas3' [Streptomyces smaragdinus]MQY15159.1 CRISPR-associated endonuclease/helicase Cas3 [Streptomyces smaragdinus]
MTNEPIGAIDPRLWGKEDGLSRPYPVICHLLDVAAMFGQLWDVVLDEPAQARIAGELGLEAGDCRAVLSFWAGLHDLGKISPPFQAMVPAAYKTVAADPSYVAAAGADRLRFRHELATHWSLISLLTEIGYPVARVQAKSLAHQVAQFLGGHHGCFADVVSKREAAAAGLYQPGLGTEGWEEQRRRHLLQLRRVVGAEAVPTGELSAVTAVRLYGLVVLADWLASETRWIEPLLPVAGWIGDEQQLDDHFRRAVREAPQRVRAARLGRARFPEISAFEQLFPFSPNALQHDVAEVLPSVAADEGSGLMVVTAPTGDGKTEAALFAAAVLGRAAGARGLYFALPTMATADAMFPRVGEFAGRALTGERALMLLHGAAWLSTVMDGGRPTEKPERWNTTDQPAVQDHDAEPATAFSAEAPTAVEADAWLRQGRRGFAAPLGAGTIDQVLAGVLPLRYNALRLFGLTDKVLIVDEAHAYGPWMQTLLVRLLEWLGAFRAPVVLLSATLTGRTVTTLVDAYRRGAGFLEPCDVRPAYPGWLFVGARTGTVKQVRAVGTERSRTLDLSVRRVAWDVDDTTADPRDGGRRSALREVLTPVATQGGTALVCCTTVAQAQQTFRDLRKAFPELTGRPGGIRLLHSRFPGLLRQEITADCEAAYGKPAKGETPQSRPASILVATQIVEQSLDFDFDLVVSDLAPLALLLQRAGRGRRHARGPQGRPAWAAQEDRPPLVVMEPVDQDGNTAPPRAWGDVYDHGLLLRTAQLLRQQTESGIEIPGDVQDLVDAVYADAFTEHLKQAGEAEVQAMASRLDLLDQRREGARLAEETLAAMTGISPPHRVRGDLSHLSRGTAEATEDFLTTRLGADTGRVLLLFTQDDGTQTLDEEGAIPLPGRGAPTRATVRRIVSRSVPVPGRWLPSIGERPELPPAWRKQSQLRDVVLLPMERQAGDRTDSIWFGQLDRRTVEFSRLTGIERI